MSRLVAVSLPGYNQWGQNSWKGVAALLVEQLLRLGIKQEPHLSTFGGSWRGEAGGEGGNSLSGLNSILGVLSRRGTFFSLLSCPVDSIKNKKFAAQGCVWLISEP